MKALAQPATIGRDSSLWPFRNCHPLENHLIAAP